MFNQLISRGYSTGQAVGMILALVLVLFCAQRECGLAVSSMQSLHPQKISEKLPIAFPAVHLAVLWLLCWQIGIMLFCLNRHLNQPRRRRSRHWRKFRQLPPFRKQERSIGKYSFVVIIWCVGNMHRFETLVLTHQIWNTSVWPHELSSGAVYDFWLQFALSLLTVTHLSFWPDPGSAFAWEGSFPRTWIVVELSFWP